MKEIDMSLSQRGFVIGNFSDYFGNKCSIQESSVMVDGGAIWLGVDKDSQGEEVSARMHLTREHVRELLPMLKIFIETGELWVNKA